MKGGLVSLGFIIILLLIIGLVIAGLGPGGFLNGLTSGWGVLFG